MIASIVPTSSTLLGTPPCEEKTEVLLHRRRVLFARAVSLFGAIACGVQMYETYRVYKSSHVSASSQAWWFCADCCLVLVHLMNASVALGDSVVPAGSTHAQAAVQASRISIQRQTLMIVFSHWLRTNVWVRGDDAVRGAYSFPGGNPLAELVVILLCCFFLLGRASVQQVLIAMPQVSMLLIGDNHGTNLLWDAASSMHFGVTVDSITHLFISVVVTVIALARLPWQLRPQPLDLRVPTLDVVVPQGSPDLVVEVDRHVGRQAAGGSTVPAWVTSIGRHTAAATSVGAQTEPSQDEPWAQDPSTPTAATSSTQTEGSTLTQSHSVGVQTLFQKCRCRSRQHPQRTRPPLAPIDEDEARDHGGVGNSRLLPRCPLRKKASSLRESEPATIHDLDDDDGLESTDPSAGPDVESVPHEEIFFLDDDQNHGLLEVVDLPPRDFGRDVMDQY